VLASTGEGSGGGGQCVEAFRATERSTGREKGSVVSRDADSPKALHDGTCRLPLEACCLRRDPP
jgi:hypothetical protein